MPYRKRKESATEAVTLLRYQLRFWIDALRLLRKRCDDGRGKNVFERTVDLHFYVDALVRIQEIACRTTKLGCIQEIADAEPVPPYPQTLAKARAALQTFHRKWPKLLTIRNQLEHLAPHLDTKAGEVIAYDARRNVEARVSVAEIHPDAEALYQSVKESLDELSLRIGARRRL